jgi:hypothetical protein
MSSKPDFKCRAIQTITLLRQTWRYRVSKNQLMSKPEFVGGESAAATGQRGKVIHDTRGNAIWDWTIETAVLAHATVDELLGRLIDPVALGLERDVEHNASWSGDPYNRPC